MIFLSNINFQYPAYPKIMYLDELMRAALEQDNTEDFIEMLENLKRSERGISSAAITNRFLIVLSLTDSDEKLAAFLEYKERPYFTNYQIPENNNAYARPIIEAMIIAIVRNDLETAKQLLHDPGNTFISAIPLYYVMLTKQYSLIPDCIEFLKRNGEWLFSKTFSSSQQTDELAYIIASAATHRDSEFLTRLFENGCTVSAFAMALTANYPDAFSFLADTFYAYTGITGTTKEFVRTALTPEYQLNFLIFLALINGKDTLDGLAQQYYLTEKINSVLSSSLQLVENIRTAFFGDFKASVNAILDRKLTVVIDDNSILFALNSSLVEEREITYDVQNYDNAFDDLISDHNSLTRLISHKLIFEPSEECPKFLQEILALDNDGSIVHQLIKSGTINKDNILIIKDYADKKNFTSTSKTLGEYINKL